jgi:hypothetical protein
MSTARAMGPNTGRNMVPKNNHLKYKLHPHPQQKLSLHLPPKPPLNRHPSSKQLRQQRSSQPLRSQRSQLN